MTVREFEISFKKWYMSLGMYALRVVGNPDDAEDLVENTFMKAWQAIQDGKNPDNFKSYMYLLVRNECIDFLRKKKIIADVSEIPDVGEETIDTSERDARIWKAIDELPEKCREIFLMSKRDGFSNEEIAEELGISIKTVKNQMTKAYSRLRESLSSGHKPFFLPFL